MENELKETAKSICRWFCSDGEEPQPNDVEHVMDVLQKVCAKQERNRMEIKLRDLAEEWVGTHWNPKPKIRKILVEDALHHLQQAYEAGKAQSREVEQFKAIARMNEDVREVLKEASGMIKEVMTWHADTQSSAFCEMAHNVTTRIDALLKGEG